MSYYKNKNVLVAGGAGLMGQCLVEKLLEAGAHVRATQFQSRKIAQEHKNLEVVSCDLTQPEEARRVFADMDIVLLAAAKVRGAKALTEDPSSLILYNLKLHANLIHLADQMKVERCSFVSSSYVYPHTGKPNVESEGFKDDPPAPMNYGLGWVCRYLETLCKHFHMTGKTRFAIIRPTAYYGPHDNFNPDQCHVIPALIVKALCGDDPFEVWGDGADVRSFTYIEDLAEGLLLTVEKYACAEALNICTGEVKTVRDVAEALGEILDFHPRVEFNKNKPSMIAYKVSDPSRAAEVLGWRAKVSLKDGLKRTLDWLRASEKNPAGGARK